jgi:hypothetical protein
MMRTIILSDISETSNSIIPYGLHIGKHTQTKVDVLHCFNPVIVQGYYSPYSDSQSITPGKKLSHDEVLQREKGIINDKLSQLLSKEASLLNYPLRVYTITEIGDTNDCISGIIKKHNNPLIITGTKPASSMTSNLKDLLKILFNYNVMIMIIPPGKKFIKPKTCCLLTNLDAEGNSTIKKLFEWLDPLVTKVFTSAVVRFNQRSNHDKAKNDWKKALQPYSDKTDITSLAVTYVDDLNIAFEHICGRKNFDMIIMPKNRDSFFSEYLFHDDNAKQLTESLNKPVLLY